MPSLSDVNLYSKHCNALSNITYMSAPHFSPPTQQFLSPHCPSWPPHTAHGVTTSDHRNRLVTQQSVTLPSKSIDYTGRRYAFKILCFHLECENWKKETLKIFMLNVIFEMVEVGMSCSVNERGCAAWLRLSPLAFNGMLSYQVLERTRASYLTLHRGWSHWSLSRFYIRGHLKII